MRILVLTQKLPLPAQDGYNLRVLAYAPRLAQRHALRLVSLDVGEFPGQLASSFEEVVRLPVRPPPRTPIPKLLPRIFSPQEMHDRDPAVEAAILSQTGAFRPDVIWCVGWNMLPYALDVPSVPVLADVIDEGAREAWIDLWAAPTPRRLIQLVRTVRFERRFFRRAARCLFVSEQDIAITRRVAPGIRAELVRNGVDYEHYAPNGEAPEPETLVFEGTMSHIPNVEGVSYFCRRVLPLLRRQHPGVRFKIVGRDPTPKVRALAEPSSAVTGVEVTGFVEDVRPHVRAAAAFVCPLIGGAGLKNKILQAWAMGKAVVATPISLGGLDARDGENVLIAEGPDRLAAACARILSDPALAARLGAAGRQTVIARYSWDQAAVELERLLGDVARQAGR
jgi:polysaccharide biosynthesis protein PslH